MSLRLSEAEVRFYSDVLFALKGIRGETDDPDIEFHVEQVTFGIDGEPLGDSVTIQASDLPGEYDLVIKEPEDYLDENFPKLRDLLRDPEPPKSYTHKFYVAPPDADPMDETVWEELHNLGDAGLTIDRTNDGRYYGVIPKD